MLKDKKMNHDCVVHIIRVAPLHHSRPLAEMASREPFAKDPADPPRSTLTEPTPSSQPPTLERRGPTVAPSP